MTLNNDPNTLEGLSKEEAEFVSDPTIVEVIAQSAGVWEQIHVTFQSMEPHLKEAADWIKKHPTAELSLADMVVHLAACVHGGAPLPVSGFSSFLLVGTWGFQPPEGLAALLWPLKKALQKPHGSASLAAILQKAAPALSRSQNTDVQGILEWAEPTFT